MKAISLFSGIGGFDLGFERAGIETVLQAEQDPHCLKVLERHWPHMRRVSDVRRVGLCRDDDLREDGGQWPERGLQPDLIYGGFPCQDLSVAGKRAGLGGERSGLWFEFHRVLSELRPRWTVIENVPGLLSSNGGRDFAILLYGLGELGYGVAWAVLDAQHFGVPQRRRRVFVVGCLGDWRSPQQVLSVCESCGGNPETGRTPGEDTARAIAVRTANTGANGYGISEVAHTLDGANGQAVLSPTLTGGAEGRGFRGDDGSNAYGSDNFVAAPLGAHHRRDDLDHDTYIPDIVSQAMSSKWAKGASGPAGDEIQNLVATSGVRRLTPLECERLQGFPDGWTEGQSDSHRYRQLGNAVAVPVAEWIGHRLVAIDAPFFAQGSATPAQHNAAPTR